MTTFFGKHDAAAIVMDHCRGTGQKFTCEPLSEDPRTRYENKYAEWRELNWNYVSRLNAGDRVSFQDMRGTFWCITVGSMPRPVQRAASISLKAQRDAMRKVKKIQDNLRGD